MKTIFLCENSPDGIFTAVYEAWQRSIAKEEIEIQAEQSTNLVLFADYVEILTDYSKAEKVTNTLRKRFGQEMALFLYQAALSTGEDKANAIYHTIRKGLSKDYTGKIMEDLADKNVCRVFELARNVTNEQHHYFGFVRFKELENGVLFAQIEPKNDLLVLIAPHFSDRLPNEDFIISDIRRNHFIIHAKNKAWILIKGEELVTDYISKFSSEEDDFQQWWRGFCTSISIKERENLSLQRQNLPLRFRNTMTEFYK